MAEATERGAQGRTANDDREGSSVRVRVIHAHARARAPGHGHVTHGHGHGRGHGALRALGSRGKGK